MPTGSEARKRLPCVVISNNSATANATATHLGRGAITVILLTSNASRAENSHLVLPPAQLRLSCDSAVQVEQVRAVDISRVGPPPGLFLGAAMEQVELALRVQLDLV